MTASGTRNDGLGEVRCVGQHSGLLVLSSSVDPIRTSLVLTSLVHEVSYMDPADYSDLLRFPWMIAALSSSCRLGFAGTEYYECLICRQSSGWPIAITKPG